MEGAQLRSAGYRSTITTPLLLRLWQILTLEHLVDRVKGAGAFIVQIQKRIRKKNLYLPNANLSIGERYNYIHKSDAL